MVIGKSIRFEEIEFVDTLISFNFKKNPTMSKFTFSENIY